MDHWLDFGFYIWNKALEKDLGTGEDTVLIDLIIDGHTVLQTNESARIQVSQGEHQCRVEILYKTSSGVHKYKSRTYTFDATDEDAIFTLNLYYLSRKGNSGFDFAPGIPPLRDEKYRNPGGCYVATCIYGSYDCPEVWTLRRFRDDTLAKTWYGRLFIHTYYKISPTAVRLFGNTALFKKCFTPILNKMVQALRAQGIENSPYQDKTW